MGNITALKDDKQLKFVVEEFERYERYHSDRFQLAADVIDQWNNVPPTKKLDWMNNVHSPVTFAAEQTLTPRIFSALFPTESPIEVQACGDTAEEQAIKIKNTLQHHFTIADVQGECIPSLVQNTLLGTCYVEVPYLYRKAWQVNRLGERYEAVIDKRPDCKSVSFFEMFPHPAKLHMKDGLPLIRRRFVDAEWIKSLADNPESKFTNIKEALDSDCPRDYRTVLLDVSGQFMDIKKRDEYELLEYWGPWDETYSKADDTVSTKKAVPYWITIVNRSVKIRSIQNPYNFQHPPYAKGILFPDCKPSWFGVGIGSVGKPTQDRLNKIINQRLDNVDLVLNKQGFYNGMDQLINVKKLQISKPGQWHKVSDTVGSIRWMETPDVTASSYKEEELAKADYREATGATVPLMPAEQGQHNTATGMSLLQGAAGIRFKPVIRKLEKDMISEIGMMFLSHLQQFMVIPEWIRIVTNDGRREPILIYPEELHGKIRIIPTGMSDTMNREVQISQLLRFKEISLNDPTVNQAMINRRIAELMSFKDIHELIMDQQPVMMGPGQLPPEAQQYIQKRMAEGASPEQIQLELFGQPGGDGPGGGQPRPRGNSQDVGLPHGPRNPMLETGMGMVNP